MRYPDCQRTDGDCSVCALSSYGRDCHNAPVNQLAYLRQRRGLTQQQLADKTEILQPHIARLESGERAIAKLQLTTAVKIADALGIANLRDLL